MTINQEDISVSYVNYSPDDVIKQRILDHIDKLDKYDLNIIWIKAVIKRQNLKYSIHLELHTSEFDVESRSHSYRIYSAIKKAVQDASKQLRRTKGKLHHKHHT